MKIAQIIDTLEIGGAERMAVNIANVFEKNNVLSYLIVTRKSGPLQDALNANAKVKILNKTSRFDYFKLMELSKYLRVNNITILHAHSSSVYWGVLLKIMAFGKVKLVFHDHQGMSAYLDRYSRIFLRLISFFIDKIIVVNEELYKWHSRFNYLYLKETVQINNFSSVKIEEISKSNSSHFKIVCVANLRKQKGHNFLIEVFRKFHLEYPKAELILVGDNRDEAPYVKELLKTIENTEGIYYLGAMNDASTILQSANLAVLTSKSEGLPLTLLEYGLVGLPVIVTRVGQCAEVVGEYGLTIQSGDVKQLYNALVWMYENPKKRAQLGQGLKERISLRYSEDSFLEEYRRMLNGI